MVSLPIAIAFAISWIAPAEAWGSSWPGELGAKRPSADAVVVGDCLNPVIATDVDGDGRVDLRAGNVWVLAGRLDRTLDLGTSRPSVADEPCDLVAGQAPGGGVRTGGAGALSTGPRLFAREAGAGGSRPFGTLLPRDGYEASNSGTIGPARLPRGAGALDRADARSHDSGRSLTLGQVKVGFHLAGGAVDDRGFAAIDPLGVRLP